MPPRRPPRPNPPDVDALRSALGQGKLVRVGIAPSGQFPDGVTGRVRRIGDPDVDGEEFIFVEVPVGGAKDVLPFAATDLIGSPIRKSSSSVTAIGSTAPRGRPRLSAVPSPLRGAGAAADEVSDPPGPRTVRPVPAGAAAAPPPPMSISAGSAPDGAPPVRAVVRSVGSRAKRASVTITISTAGDDSSIWRIDARIGAKPAVRPTVIPPSRVWDLVQSLGEPKLTGLVKSLLEDHRKATQARADALAAELSALQNELKTFPDNKSE